MPRASFYTVGCKLNTYESETLRDQFAGLGYDVVAFGDAADVTVINTCTVTDRSDADCRKIIRRARRASPGALIVVTGCMAERWPDGIAAMPEVGLVLGNKQKPSLVRHVERARAACCPDRRAAMDDPPPAPSFLSVGRVDQARAARGSVACEPSDERRTRATLQVQDGCDERCTYCIIPSVRGRSRSRLLADVVADARALVAAGYREIALTGVNTGAWGDDIGGGESLVDLVRALAALPGVERVRLNSIEPRAMTPELIEFVAATPRVCRHFHIPLQSGSDAVLRRMNRRYRAADYERVVTALAERVPDCAIGADVMVGLPGETEEQFGETCRFVERLPLTYLHVFAYSLREGTPAERLDGHLPRHVKAERSRELRRLGVEKRLAFHERHVGRVVQVLVERARAVAGSGLCGLTENYVRVRVNTSRVAAPEAYVNEIVPVRITGATPEGADGVLEEPVPAAKPAFR